MHPTERLKILNANARKSLSQNFLTSPHWAETLTALALRPQNVDEYWEIGPGLGALTEPLVRRAKKPVRVFEYDKIFAQNLREVFPKITVEEGDFLEADLSAHSHKKISVLSNLPYHISSAIFFKMLDAKPIVSQLVFTFQKEFAERLSALPRTKAYGSLSVLAQLHFQIESVGVLPKGAFFPAPEVASEALLMFPKQTLAHSQLVHKVVKGAFVHRRKKLLGNLKRLEQKTPWNDILRTLRVHENARPEELGKDEYVELTEEARRLGFA